MPRVCTLSFGLALPIALLAQSAFADLTPDQVWSDWRDYMENLGYQVTADETTNGADLVVENISFGFEMPADGGTVGMEIGTLSFLQNNDGSVEIVMPAETPLVANGIVDHATGHTMSFAMTMQQTDHSMVASGNPDDITYDYSAANVAMIMDDMKSQGSDMPDDIKMNVSMADVIMSTRMTIGDLRGYLQSGEIGSLTYTVGVDVPAEGVQFDMSGQLADLSFNGEGEIPTEGVNAADMSAMLAAGFAFSGNILFGEGTTDIKGQDPENGNFDLSSRSGGGNIDIDMGQQGIAYDVTQTDTSVSAQLPNLPFPVSFEMEEAGFVFAMPLAPSDEPQDFGFGFTMGNFTMSDMIWSIFDPAGQLPRDPATIDLDLTGKVTMLVDLMNPEAAAELTGAPGELNALTINTIVLDAVGARLEGAGDFGFDPDAPGMMPGMPAPVGAVDLSLSGANGLLDKLVSMGLLPEDQAMGARMMMGLFAVPGDAPDTLKSKIEMTEDGQILANGQRIR